jgi:hypothetical protein
MFKSTPVQSKINKKIVALTLSLTTILSLVPITPSLAKPNQQSRYNSSLSVLPLIFDNSKQNNRKLGLNNSHLQPQSNSNWNNRSHLLSQSSNSGSLNVGTIIYTTLPSANKILVTPEETMAVTLVVREDVTDSSNQVVIPSGSEIVGEIIPSGQGSRFVANTLILGNGNESPISATSPVVTTTETVSTGKNNNTIWQGALVGAAAGTVISAITGDKAIATEEVLGGAGLGALAGLLVRGDYTQEFISINPEQDLDLTLTSNLTIN